MITVHVQVLGPLDIAPGAYDWITIGRIDSPKSLDVDYLSRRIMKFVRESEYRPQTDAVRLQVMMDGRKEMIMTLMDFFKNQKEVK